MERQTGDLLSSCGHMNVNVLTPGGYRDSGGSGASGGENDSASGSTAEVIFMGVEQSRHMPTKFRGQVRHVIARKKTELVMTRQRKSTAGAS